MQAFVHDWLNLLIRWAHLIAGIMWIGSSFYFVWLDSSFEKPATEKKGLDGELYMVHGGNFYRVEKRRFGAGEMPRNLHWFYWEATFTWITGFFLLMVMYYFGNTSYLVDPTVRDISLWHARALGLFSFIGAWFIYDGLFRLKISEKPWFNFAALGLLGSFIYYLTQNLSGRAAYIHVGAMFGTMMVLNVWVHILPNQAAIIRASEKNEEPDYELGKKAKRRSMHNSYMTLPVLFIMISNHFPSTFAHPQNWLVLILMVAFGALVRHFMITEKKIVLLPALGVLGVILALTAQPYLKNLKAETATQSSEASKYPSLAGNRKIKFVQVYGILQTRCIQCHAAQPTDDEITIAPNDVKFETPEQIKANVAKILERVVHLQNMPMNNKTLITDEERAILGRWIEQGANMESWLEVKKSEGATHE